MVPIAGELLTIKIPAKLSTTPATVDEVRGSFEKSLNESGLIPILEADSNNLAKPGKAAPGDSPLKTKLPLLEGVIQAEHDGEVVDTPVAGPVEGTKDVIGKEDPQGVPVVPPQKGQIPPVEVPTGLPKTPRHHAVQEREALEIGKKVEKKDSQKPLVAVAVTDHKMSVPLVPVPTAQIAQTAPHGKGVIPTLQPVPPIANVQTPLQPEVAPDEKRDQPIQGAVGTVKVVPKSETSRETPALVQPEERVADSSRAVMSPISQAEPTKTPAVPVGEKKDKISGAEVDPRRGEVDTGSTTSVGVAVTVSHHVETSRQDGGITLVAGEHVTPIAAVRHEAEPVSGMLVGRPGVGGTAGEHVPVRDTNIEVARGRGPELVTATPTSLEVGMPSGAHGWLKVRAELEGGVVTASLSAATETGREALHRELPSMAAYLQDEKVGVSALVVKETPQSDARQPFDGSGAGPQGQGQPQGQGSERQESGATSRASDGVWSMTEDERVQEVSNGLNASTGLLSPTAGASGSWLNVRV